MVFGKISEFLRNHRHDSVKCSAFNCFLVPFTLTYSECLSVPVEHILPVESFLPVEVRPIADPVDTVEQKEEEGTQVEEEPVHVHKVLTTGATQTGLGIFH